MLRKAATQHYSGRWAQRGSPQGIGTGWRRGISWHDIEVRNDKNGTRTLSSAAGRATSWMRPASPNCTSRSPTAEPLRWRPSWQRGSELSIVVLTRVRLGWYK